MFNKKNESGVYAPCYYCDFACVADRCKHSCCIDWEIGIDDLTYQKYTRMGDVFNTVKRSEDGPIFALCENGRCPHLNDVGLCNIILSYGEETLPEICRNHPRFYNLINSRRIEVGLGIVCEEACRLILENEKPFSLVKIEHSDETQINNCDFDALSQRDYIISVIEADGDFDEKITALTNEFRIPDLYTPDEWLERFLSLETLDGKWKSDLEAMRGKLFRKSSRSADEYGKYYERLLTYFVYRHVSIADSSENLRARLAFAILSVRLIRSFLEEDQTQTPEKLMDWARRYSAEIEYSEDNTAELIFAFELHLP